MTVNRPHRRGATAVVGDSLFYSGALSLQEHESAKFLKLTLEGISFKVEVGRAGMLTKLRAQWGSGEPKIVSSPRSTRCP